ARRQFGPEFRRLCPARRAGLDERFRSQCAVGADHANRQARRACHLPYRRRRTTAARASFFRDAWGVALQRRAKPRAGRGRPLFDLWRVPSLYARMTDAAARMDRMYRYQRYIYDLSRKFYLLGRDALIAEIGARPSDAILEVACGTARNLVNLA